MTHKKKLYKTTRKIIGSGLMGAMCFKFSLSFAYGQSSIFSTRSNLYLRPLDTGSSEYLCSNRHEHCSLWNTNKINNVDPYKEIRVNLGKFKFTLPKGHPTFSSQDNRFNVSLGMNLQLDAGGFFGPDRGKGRKSPNMAGSQNLIRRGRFQVMVRYDDFVVTVTPDIARQALVNESLHEANLKYIGFKQSIFAIGLIQPFLTMGDSESSSAFPILERPMVLDMVRGVAGGDARLSLMGLHWGKRYFISATMTGQRIGEGYRDFQKNDIGGIIRAAIHPVKHTDYDLHLGVTGAFAIHGNNRKYSMSTGQEAQLWLGRPYIKTGTLQNVNSIWAVGPEIGVRFKRMMLQSEYYSFFLPRQADRIGGPSPDLHFSGWYVTFNYTLFGQPRSYDISRAVFSPPTGSLFNPAIGAWGALEWSARWSNMDMNSKPFHRDRMGKYNGAQGGVQNVFATGFNWYPSIHMRVSLDYNHIAATHARNSYYNRAGRNSNVLISRLQFTF